jgi:nucleoid DNA-binding protein
MNNKIPIHQLVAESSEITGIDRETCAKAVGGLLTKIKEHLLAGDDVQIPPVGHFSLRSLPRPGGDSVTRLSFRPMLDILKSVRGHTPSVDPTARAKRVEQARQRMREKREEKLKQISPVVTP